jgi:hypothetical protein
VIGPFAFIPRDGIVPEGTNLAGAHTPNSGS